MTFFLQIMVGVFYVVKSVLKHDISLIVWLEKNLKLIKIFILHSIYEMEIHFRSCMTGI